MTLLEIRPPIRSAGLSRAAHNRYRVLVVHGDFFLEDGWLVWHLYLHPCLLLRLQLLLPCLLVLLPLVLLLDLPQKGIFDRILVLLLLLHHDRLLVTALEDSAACFQLQVGPVFQNFTAGHDSRKVALGLHRVLVVI